MKAIPFVLFKITNGAVYYQIHESNYLFLVSSKDLGYILDYARCFETIPLVILGEECRVSK